MRKTLYILFFMMMVVVCATAQTPDQANTVFTRGDYASACPMYKKLMAADPSNPVYIYRYARCLGELGQTEQSIRYFESVGERYLTNYFITEQYFRAYRFADAKASIEKYIATINETHERYAQAMKWAELANYATRLLGRTEDVVIYQVDDAPRSSWRAALSLPADAGHIEADGAFVNARGDRRIYSDEEGHLFTQSRLLDEWSEPEQLPFKGQNPFLSGDGVTIYYSWQNEEGLGGLDLYMTRYNTATNTYLQPSALGMPFISTANDYFYAVDEATGCGLVVSDLDCADSLVHIYRFMAPTEEKHYLRDSSDTYIRQMARRQIIRDRTTYTASAADEDLEQTPSVLEEDQPEQPDFRFVLNDSVVYTHLSDFHNDEARTLYLQYEDILQQIADEEAQLAQKRTAYSLAETPEEKKQFVPVILALEQDILRLKREAAPLPNEVRKQEGQRAE